MEAQQPERRRRLAELLRAIRTERDVTQVALAARLGVPQSVVSKYESGARQIGCLEVEAVCKALGVSLQTFVRRWQTPE